MESFCKNLPKIELHAHLNGSLSDNTLELLQKLKFEHTDENEKTKSEYKIIKGESRTLSDCFAVFKLAQALTDTPDAIKKAVVGTLQEFHDENVIYLELRSTPRQNDNMTKTQYVQALIDGVIESSKHITMKTCLLISIDRRNSLEYGLDTVEIAASMSKVYPDIVVGIDLSGDPTVGEFSEIVKILDKGRNAGLKVAIHAAETPNEIETLDIINWKPDRLGHMTCSTEAIMGSKTIWNSIIESKIPIELCLTSNVNSRSVTSYKNHQFKDFYEAHHPISIATDDKGVFNTSLSEEFNICANTFNLSKEELWNLSYKAIEQCFCSDSVKEDLAKKLSHFKEHEMSSFNGN